MNDLHRLSYEELRKRLDALTGNAGISTETYGLIHELEVHQVELEMQNRELREAQQALEESRDRYAGLYDLAPVGYLTLDRRGTIRELNLTAAALLGTDRAQLGGASLLNWTEPADRPRLLAHLRGGFLPGMVTGVDLRLRLRSGEVRHVRLQTLYLEDPEHATQACRTAMIDNTDHERSQAALRASEQRCRATFENAAVGMALVSLDGRLLRVNQRLCAITGYAEAELAGKPHRDITDPADVAHEVEQAGRLHAGEIASYSLEKRYRRKDGSTVWVNVTAALQADSEGLPDHFVAVIEDITARRAAEDALRNADRRKDEFLMMLGHELRNPLAPIRSATETLRGGLATDPRQVRWAADIIARQVEHMTRLVDDLLDVSRITHGSIRLHKAPFDLREALELAAEQARPRLAARHQTLDLALPPAAVTVHGDPVRLAQVIANLLVNASKFSPPETRVDLHLEEAGGHARVQVCDRGAGIAADMLQRIFEPFVQACQPGERSPDGIGLGLALSRGLVLMHGGELEAESPGLGRGSTFTLRLPLGLAAPPPPAPEPAPAPPTRGRGLVILIVDDNRDVAESSAMLLGLAGHQAHTAGDGETALAAIESLHPDVVLLDIGLPGMDGFEVARRLRRTAAGARATILAVSGYDLASRPTRDGETLFDGQLLKPAGLETILATIEGCRQGGTKGG